MANFSYSDLVQAKLDGNFSSPLWFYPNPLESGTLYLEVLDQKIRTPLTIRVFDKIGRELHKKSWRSDELNGRLELDLQNLSTGIYSLKIQAAGYNKIEKLLIR